MLRSRILELCLIRQNVEEDSDPNFPTNPPNPPPASPPAAGYVIRSGRTSRPTAHLADFVNYTALMANDFEF